MKRTFSREYWFLLGCWAVFSILGLVAGMLGAQAAGIEPFWRFEDPAAAASVMRGALSVLSAACSALSGAAMGILAIRYWIKPYLLAWLLVLVWQAGISWPGLIRSGGIGYVLLSLVSLVLGGGLTFGLAKGLYRLLKGREWAVALVLVALGTAVRLISLLVTLQNIPTYVETTLAADSRLSLLRETLLSAASYILLYLCIRKWWETPAQAAADRLEEEKEEIEEALFEEERREAQAKEGEKDGEEN